MQEFWDTQFGTLLATFFAWLATFLAEASDYLQGSVM